MAVDYSKILSHPESESIISKLVSGITPKDIAEYLKIKYQGKDEAHLRLSAALLKDFIDSNLNLYETLNQDIQAAKNGNLDKKVSAFLRNNRTYQQIMVEMADKEVDVKKMLQKVAVLLEVRLEQFWDKMQENPANLKADYGLLKYFETLMNYTEKYNKIVNQSPDQIIQHNVTVQVMDQYVAIFQDAIRETLAEIDPDSAFSFMEKFNEKFQNLQLPEQMKVSKPLTTEKRYLEAEVLSTKLEEIEGKS